MKSTHSQTWATIVTPALARALLMLRATGFIITASAFLGCALTLAAEPQRPEPAKEAPVNLTPGAKARPGLYDEILKADAEFFHAFFDTCDVDTVRRYIADDFEMFHDKGGRVTTSGADFIKATQDKCKRQADGIDFLSTRKLVPESMKVYPINNYGAIQTGVHRFYAIQKGKPDRLTETAQFTQVWKEENGQWKLARVLSYDHQLAPQ